MTPSIISRASSSSSPSRWPSLTIVRISSSIDSSSASLRRAAGHAMQQRIDDARSPHERLRQPAHEAPQRPGRVQELGRADPRDRPGQPHGRDRRPASPSTTAAIAKREPRPRARRRQLSAKPTTMPAHIDSADEQHHDHLDAERHAFVVPENIGKSLGALALLADFLQLVARERVQRPRGDRGHAGRQQAGNRDPEQGVGVHQVGSLHPGAGTSVGRRPHRCIDPTARTPNSSQVEPGFGGPHLLRFGCRLVVDSRPGAACRESRTATARPPADQPSFGGRRRGRVGADDHFAFQMRRRRLRARSSAHRSASRGPDTGD